MATKKADCHGNCFPRQSAFSSEPIQPRERPERDERLCLRFSRGVRLIRLIPRRRVVGASAHFLLCRNRCRLQQGTAALLWCRTVSKLLFGVVLRGNDLLATVVTGRADVVTAVHFTGRRFNSGRRIGQEVVSTMIAALRDGLLILLNSHFYTPRGKT